MAYKACPHKGSKEWIELVGKYGEDLAYRLFYENNYDTPTLAVVDKYLKGVVNQDLGKVQSTLKGQLQSLANRRNQLFKSKNALNTLRNQKQINEITKAEFEIQKKIQDNQYTQAIGILIDRIHTDLSEKLDYIRNKDNRKDAHYLDEVLASERYISEHQKILIPEFGYGKRVLTNKINESSNLLHQLSRQIVDEKEFYFKTMIDQKTSNPELKNNEEAISQALKEGKDITGADAWLGDIFSSLDPVLAIVGKKFRELKQEIFHNTDGAKHTLRKLGNNIARLNGGKVDYSFMKDSGGHIVNRTSVDYKNADSELVKEVRDDNGQPLEYYQITSLEGADPKKVEFNKELQAKKEKIRNWKQPEIIDELTGEVTDGENHKLTQEFKDARNQFEELKHSGKRWEWVKKDGVDEAAYQDFLKKYYQEPKVLWVAVKTDQGYDGTVRASELKFPKNDFVEVTDKWVNPKYAKLQNDTSELGKAQKAFYDQIVHDHEEGILSRLPSSTLRKMIGRQPRVRASFYDQASRNGDGYFKAFGKQVRNYFKPDAYTGGRLFDENGVTSSDVPLFFISDLKSQEKIEKIEAKIENLKQTDPKYKEELKKLNAELAKEKAKLEESELEPDLVEAYSKFYDMAENYILMKEYESTVLAAKDILTSKKFVKDNGKVVSGENSNAVKFFTDWVSNVFYSEDEKEAGILHTVAKRLNSFTSIKGLGLNPVSGVNNYVMGRINQRIEAFAGIYFSSKSYGKTRAEYFREYLPNLFKEFKSDGEKYSTDVAYSKYSATVKFFNFIDIKHEQGMDANSILFAFANGGEFANQSRTGIAVLRDHQVKNKDGKMVSLYDEGLDFIDGKIVVKDGIEFTKADRIALTNKIKGINANIHGRYSMDEKAAIQRNILGKMALTFHKWIYPAYKSRFKAQYFDEELGITQEGRYRAMLHFFNDFKKFNFHVLTTYDKMTDLEKANVRRTLAELAFFILSYISYALFKKLVEGLGEEDKEVKTLLNYLSYQNSRQMSELIYFINPYSIVKFAQNPIPSLKVLEEGLDVVGSGLGIPYNLTVGNGSANYYKNGIHKGDLKFIKNLKDFTPVLKNIDLQTRFDETQEFFIGK